MNKSNDTIFALGTPKSKSAICLFRISGKESIKCIKKISNNKKIPVKKPSLCFILDNEKNIIDEGMVTIFEGPSSYTGENMAEISCHGSISIIKKITEVLIDNNIRPAEPGEFTKRALLNNKLSLIKAETINELINSETENQRKIAIKNLTGSLDEYIEETVRWLYKLLADIEAIIDFTDEELPPKLFKSIKEQKRNIIKSISKCIERSSLSKGVFSGYTVTVIGKPNTGKSSFINYINNKNVSIVTNIPGTTTDLITSVLEINGNKYTFIDTAGIRKHKNLIEKIGIERSLESAKNSDLTIVFLKNNETKSYKNIVSKIFVKSKFDINKSGHKGVQNISSFSGYGIKKLLKNIDKKIKKNNFDGATFSRERHINNLKKALYHLETADLKNIDLASENIRISIGFLLEINQKFDIENILDIIFSDFCIGK